MIYDIGIMLNLNLVMADKNFLILWTKNLRACLAGSQTASYWDRKNAVYHKSK